MFPGLSLKGGDGPVRLPGRELPGEPGNPQPVQAENEIGRSWREGDRRVGNDEAEGLLQLGGALLGMGTR